MSKKLVLGLGTDKIRNFFAFVIAFFDLNGCYILLTGRKCVNFDQFTGRMGSATNLVAVIVQRHYLGRKAILAFSGV